MDRQKSKENEEPIYAPHAHDVISGRGNETIAYAHPGNVHFRHLVKCFKLQYVASKKSDKPAFAKAIVMSIKKKSPPGRFLKQDKSTGLWHDIGYKLSLAKTRQALREGAPLIGKQIQHHKEEKKRQENEQRRQLQNNLEGAMNAVMMQHQRTIPALAAPSASTLLDLLKEKRASMAGLLPPHAPPPQGVGGIGLQQSQGHNISDLVRNLIDQRHASVTHSNPIISTPNSAANHVSNTVLASNLDLILANNIQRAGSMLVPERLMDGQRASIEALAHQQIAAVQSPLGMLRSAGMRDGGISFEQALLAQQSRRREQSIQEAISISHQERLIQLLHQRQQQQHQIRQLEEMHRAVTTVNAPPRLDDSNHTEEDAMGGLLLLKDRNQMQVKNG